MNRNRALLPAAVVAGLWLSSASAQEYRNDYRYPAAQDAARQSPQPSSPVPSQQTQAPVASPAPAQPACPACGTVDSVRVTQKPGEGSAVGLIAGGLLGGLLGHQVGQGRGNTATTIIGAAGGAYAGNQVERNAKKTVQYDVTVRMADGTVRTITYDIEPGFRAGDKVRFVDGRLTRS
jgi:outer membrane lipoprotein SlyB